MLDSQLAATKPPQLVARRGRGRDRGERRHRGLDQLRDRRRARLWPYPAEGRQDLDAADHHGRAEGPRGAGGLRPADGRQAWRVQEPARPGRKSASRKPPSSAITTPALLPDHRRRPGRHRARRAAAASSACRPSSSRRTSGPATAGASATSRSACTIRSGTTICPTSPFPKNWPVFSPKDKIGDWLEMYAKVMELNYWALDRMPRAPSTTTKRKEWTVVVERDGKDDHAEAEAAGARHRHVRQAEHAELHGHGHLQGRAAPFRRSIPGPTPMPARRRVVIGSNNSAHDICAALWEARRRRHHGAALVDPHRQVGHADGARPSGRSIRSRRSQAASPPTRPT